MTEHTIEIDDQATHISVYSKLSNHGVIGPLSDGDTIKIVKRLKTIDMSRIVGTRIPMLFGDRPDHMKREGRLVSIEKSADGILYFKSTNGKDDLYTHCHFDTSADAWVSWGTHRTWYNDGKCPLPDGVIVAAILDSTNYVKRPASELDWELTKFGNITHFKVEAIDSNYRYEND